MNWIKIERHQSWDSKKTVVYINIDQIVSISAIKSSDQDGAVIQLAGGTKEITQATPDDIIEMIKGLFDHVHSTE